MIHKNHHYIERDNKLANEKIGIIGLGAMGFPIAKHLLNKGYEIQIAKHSDKKESINRVRQLELLGAKVIDETYNIPIGMDIIITLLPGDREVSSVLLDKRFYENTNKDTVIIEMTSCSPHTVIEVQEYYSKKGISIIDAPVSGGVIGAENGSLTIFGSGDKDVFEQLDDLLKSFADNIYYIGKVGSGKTLKSINQMMVAINTMGLIEGFNVAMDLGIDLDVMHNVLSKSSGNSYVLNRYINRLKEHDFEGGFKLKLMRKDVKTALDSVSKVSLPFSNLAYTLLLMAKEYDELDFSVVSKLPFNE